MCVCVLTVFVCGVHMCVTFVCSVYMCIVCVRQLYVCVLHAYVHWYTHLCMLKFVYICT